MYTLKRAVLNNEEHLSKLLSDGSKLTLSEASSQIVNQSVSHSPSAGYGGIALLDFSDDDIKVDLTFKLSMTYTDDDGNEITFNGRIKGIQRESTAPGALIYAQYTALDNGVNPFASVQILDTTMVGLYDPIAESINTPAIFFVFLPDFNIFAITNVTLIQETVHKMVIQGTDIQKDGVSIIGGGHPEATDEQVDYTNPSSEYLVMTPAQVKAMIDTKPSGGSFLYYYQDDADIRDRSYSKDIDPNGLNVHIVAQTWASSTEGLRLSFYLPSDRTDAVLVQGVLRNCHYGSTYMPDIPICVKVTKDRQDFLYVKGAYDPQNASIIKQFTWMLTLVKLSD